MLSVPPCAMTHIVSVPVISKSSVRFRTAKHVLALTSVPTNDSRISPVSTSQFRMDRSHEHVHNDRGFSNTHPVTRSVCPSNVNIALPLCSFRVLSSSNFLLLLLFPSSSFPSSSSAVESIPPSKFHNFTVESSLPVQNNLTLFSSSSLVVVVATQFTCISCPRNTLCLITPPPLFVFPSSSSLFLLLPFSSSRNTLAVQSIPPAMTKHPLPSLGGAKVTHVTLPSCPINRSISTPLLSCAYTAPS